MHHPPSQPVSHSSLSPSYAMPNMPDAYYANYSNQMPINQPGWPSPLPNQPLPHSHYNDNKKSLSNDRFNKQQMAHNDRRHASTYHESALPLRDNDRGRQLHSNHRRRSRSRSQSISLVTVQQQQREKTPDPPSEPEEGAVEDIIEVPTTSTTTTTAAAVTTTAATKTTTIQNTAIKPVELTVKATNKIEPIKEKYKMGVQRKSGACLFFDQRSVPNRTTSTELLQEFERFGPTGIALDDGDWHVHFYSKSDARRCHLVMDGKHLFGRKLALEFRSEPCYVMLTVFGSTAKSRSGELSSKNSTYSQEAIDRRRVVEASYRVKEALLNAFLSDVTNKIISGRIFDFYESTVRSAHTTRVSVRELSDKDILTDTHTHANETSLDTVADDNPSISSILSSLPRFKKRSDSQTKYASRERNWRHYRDSSSYEYRPLHRHSLQHPLHLMDSIIVTLIVVVSEVDPDEKVLWIPIDMVYVITTLNLNQIKMRNGIRLWRDGRLNNVAIHHPLLNIDVLH
ncbi:hypothetical protein BDF19DRAFT_224153 [Syncephalis fuscata]|nr:hypothetical protein BDF19DRAFT_224153 [Syncephalis fuscata]